MKKIINKKENGITLIALVITIIVLLILAGVTISMLSGENGILKQASKAKNSSDKAQLSESIKLAATSIMTNVEHKLTEEEFKAKLEEDGYKINEEDGTVTENNEKYAVTNKGAVKATIKDLKHEEATVYTNTKLKDENGHSITIPMHFNISSESPILITEGIVIEDSQENQYVWIPVFTNSQYDWGVDYSEVEIQTEDSNAYYTAIQTALKKYTNPLIDEGTYTYGSSKYEDSWYTYTYGYYEKDDIDKKNLKYFKNGNMTSSEYKKLYRSMLKSVYINGGFYIARYEMGIGVVKSTTEAEKISRTSMTEYISTQTNTNNTAPTIQGMTAPLSKANAVAYTYITQMQGQMLARKLEEKNDYSNVTSSLLFGIQWEMTCIFIEKFDTNNTAEPKTSWIKDSEYCKYWGNYKHSEYTLDRGYYTTSYAKTTITWIEDYSTKKGPTTVWLCTTGASDQNSSLNIYDFAGNLQEWTLERSTGNNLPCVPYGGIFTHDFHSANRRNGGFTCTSNNNTTGRTMLLIK